MWLKNHSNTKDSRDQKNANHNAQFVIDIQNKRNMIMPETYQILLKWRRLQIYEAYCDVHNLQQCRLTDYKLY